MDLALILFALPICIADTSTFVIPNMYSKILTYVTSLHLIIHGFGNWQVLVLPISFLLIMVLLHVGMGDIKLLALMLVTHVNSAISIVPCVFLYATIHIMMVFLVRGRFPLKIPLAPSIFLGFATYLATT